MAIDLSLANIWRSWYLFEAGKKKTAELVAFEYYLEPNLFNLYLKLNSGQYRHGGYRYFMVTDSKRRKIAVANIGDRVVHRLVYEYLVSIFDKTFIFDTWSCRKGKGLIAAIVRTQKFVNGRKDFYCYRADIEKFFDNIDHCLLIKFLFRKIACSKARWLLKAIIYSYNINSRGCGIPIGNLTSQIFANIYLNELDRFIKHDLKVKFYLRYGDDFIIISRGIVKLKNLKQTIRIFCREKLKIKIKRNNIIIKISQGIKFLGTKIYPSGRNLTRKNLTRIRKRLNFSSSSSYLGLVKKHCSAKIIKEFNWILKEKIDE